MADSKIELRSEKVRHIIGEIPSGIVRYGIMIITIVILGLLVGAYFIPYPYTIDCKAVAIDNNKVTLLIPYKYLNEIKKGAKVTIEFEGYNSEAYPCKNGFITNISHIPVKQDGHNFFMAHVQVNRKGYSILHNMTGTASILINNKTILHLLAELINR